MSEFSSVTIDFQLMIIYHQLDSRVDIILLPECHKISILAKVYKEFLKSSSTVLYIPEPEGPGSEDLHNRNRNRHYILYEA